IEKETGKLLGTAQLHFRQRCDHRTHCTPCLANLASSDGNAEQGHTPSGEERSTKPAKRIGKWQELKAIKTNGLESSASTLAVQPSQPETLLSHAWGWIRRLV
ncbi:MAG TPA: hypothetical protein VFR42_02655, partial [Candidatus Acidoferrum sp.]|nr:hypothetical protein [Candidatus Acidoferrum sp.]